MNYIGLLTKEEKSILCGIITGKEFQRALQEKRTGIFENTERFQSQIIDRTTGIVNCHIQY